MSRERRGDRIERRAPRRVPLAPADRGAVRELTALLEQEAQAFDALHRAQQQSRMAFVTRRAAELTTALQALAPIAEQLRGLEQRRAALATQLGIEHDRVSALLPHVAVEQQATLARAAAQARDAASRVRIESGVGTNLLDFARRAHEAMLQALMRGSEVRAYDRHARSVVHGAGGGGFVSGRV